MFSRFEHIFQILKKSDFRHLKAHSTLLRPRTEACIGVIGIQDICHFTSRDIGYYPFYFQGYRILCSISGILCLFFFAEK